MVPFLSSGYGHAIDTYICGWRSFFDSNPISTMFGKSNKFSFVWEGVCVLILEALRHIVYFANLLYFRGYWPIFFPYLLIEFSIFYFVWGFSKRIPLYFQWVVAHHNDFLNENCFSHNELNEQMLILLL